MTFDISAMDFILTLKFDRIVIIIFLVVFVDSFDLFYIVLLVFARRLGF